MVVAAGCGGMDNLAARGGRGVSRKSFEGGSYVAAQVGFRFRKWRSRRTAGGSIVWGHLPLAGA